MSTSMAVAGQKRKASNLANTSSSSMRKRPRNFDYRAIDTQTADAALSKTGELNIASFIKAREYEIDALDRSMKKARKALSSRSFQQVPRHLRRRTASHNAKKVPRRLRGRALREMKDDNTPTVTARTRTPTSRMRLRLETAKALKQLTQKRKTARQKKREAKANMQETDPAKHVDIVRVPRVRKNELAKPPLATSKFKRRQVNKTWLPTHLWHTKRARMTIPTEPLWRMAIPLTPTEKTYRATHRAADSRGCVAWDMSYISNIGCLGTEKALEALLRAFGFDGEGWTGPRYEKWKAGSRFTSGWIRSKDSQEAIAVVTVLWCATEQPVADKSVPHADHDEDTDMTTEKTAPKRRKVKLDRRILVRIHPSAFHVFWVELLKSAKMQKPQVLVEDLRFELGSIEVAGPGSSEALTNVLKLHETSETMTHVWTSMSSLTNPALLPTGALLSLNVCDPRLDRPSRQVKKHVDVASEDDLHDLTVEWPVDRSMKPSLLFSHRSRCLANRLPSQKSIDRRRRDGLPGQPLMALPKDPQIPIMLLAQRTAATGSTHSGSWVLLAPWRCIDAIWRQLLVYPLSSGARPRFGGLHEKQQVAFEHQVPWFPGDYPGTEAGKAWEGSQAEHRFDEWLRRPPSRRLAWHTLDLGLGRKGEVGRGWTCDWQYLFHDLPSASKPKQTERTKPVKESATSSSTGPSRQVLLTQRQRKAARAREQGRDEATARRRNTSSPESDAGPDSGLEETVDFAQITPALSKPILRDPTRALSSKPLVLSVRIRLLTKGTPKTAARIYRIPLSRSASSTQSAEPDVVQSRASQPRPVDATPPPSQRSPSTASSTVAGSASVRHDQDLRTRWLAMDPHDAPRDLPRKMKKDRTNRHGLPRKHQHQERESLRHINVLPKNAPAEIREQYGRKSLTEAEKKAMIEKELAVGLEEEKVWDVHVPCPEADDLIGFVTSGGYNLAEGQGTAIGGVWLQKLVGGWAEQNQTAPGLNMSTSGTSRQHSSKSTKRHAQLMERERHLCVVRNAGESVGRLAVWDVCA